MKATDIMVGDILQVNKDVCLKRGTIVKVHAVDGDNFFREKELKGCATCSDINDKYSSGGIWLAYLEPILLTTKILEKNGFKPHKIGKCCPYYVYKDGNDIFSVGLFSRTTELEYVNMIYNPEDVSEENYRQDLEFPYFINVHELQHALRLCGLNELADNFKI